MSWCQHKTTFNDNQGKISLMGPSFPTKEGSEYNNTAEAILKTLKQTIWKW